MQFCHIVRHIGGGSVLQIRSSYQDFGELAEEDNRGGVVYVLRTVEVFLVDIGALLQKLRSQLEGVFNALRYFA